MVTVSFWTWWLRHQAGSTAALYWLQTVLLFYQNQQFITYTFPTAASTNGTQLTAIIPTGLAAGTTQITALTVDLDSE